MDMLQGGFAGAPAATLAMTALDFETTGSVPGWPVEPWQVGLVKISAGKVAANTGLDSLVHVGERPFSAHAPGRHGRLRAQIASAPAFDDLWPRLKPHLLGRPLVAHQAAVERNLLRRLAPLQDFGPWIDTLRLVRHAYPGLASCALPDVLESFGLVERVRSMSPGRTFHDAFFDAVACAVLLEHLLAQPGWRTVTLGQLVSV